MLITMKENFEKKISAAVKEIKAIAAQDLNPGRYRMIINRCGKIIAWTQKAARAAQQGNDFEEYVGGTAITHEEVAATCEKRQADRNRILEHLKEFGSLTTLEAIDMGILRCGARVFELRKAGEPIATELIKVGRDRIAKYIYNR